MAYECESKGDPQKSEFKIGQYSAMSFNVSLQLERSASQLTIFSTLLPMDERILIRKL
jgi:hypothetical protein